MEACDPFAELESMFSTVGDVSGGADVPEHRTEAADCSGSDPYGYLQELYGQAHEDSGSVADLGAPVPVEMPDPEIIEQQSLQIGGDQRLSSGIDGQKGVDNEGNLCVNLSTAIPKDQNNKPWQGAGEEGLEPRQTEQEQPEKEQFQEIEDKDQAHGEQVQKEQAQVQIQQVQKQPEMVVAETAVIGGESQIDKACEQNQQRGLAPHVQMEQLANGCAEAKAEQRVDGTTFASDFSVNSTQEESIQTLPNQDISCQKISLGNVSNTVSVFGKDTRYLPKTRENSCSSLSAVEEGTPPNNVPGHTGEEWRRSKSLFSGRVAISRTAAKDLSISRLAEPRLVPADRRSERRKLVRELSPEVSARLFEQVVERQKAQKAKISATPTRKKIAGRLSSEAEKRLYSHTRAQIQATKERQPPNKTTRCIKPLSVDTETRLYARGVSVQRSRRAAEDAKIRRQEAEFERCFAARYPRQQRSNSRPSLDTEQAHSALHKTPYYSPTPRPSVHTILSMECGVDKLISCTVVCASDADKLREALRYHMIETVNDLVFLAQSRSNLHKLVECAHDLCEPCDASSIDALWSTLQHIKRSARLQQGAHMSRAEPQTVQASRSDVLDSARCDRRIVGPVSAVDTRRNFRRESCSVVNVGGMYVDRRGSNAWQFSGVPRTSQWRAASDGCDVVNIGHVPSTILVDALYMYCSQQRNTAAANLLDSWSQELKR